MITKYETGQQAPADLEQFLRERAKQKEEEYFELLTGVHSELDDRLRNMPEHDETKYDICCLMVF